ncbi:hypothetical protein [Nocardiopsis alba]|uniref:phage terminase small subunit n=1 Tax=Nocardiopsis alba TaxID=53437 RepID=UPI003D755899
MAGYGPPPNPNRRRQNADAVTGARRVRCPECGTLRAEDATCAMCAEGPAVQTGPGASGPRIAAPELPTPKKWLSQTRAWWDAWTSSVQVTVFEPSDWQTLIALLPLVDAMNRETADPLKRMKLFEAVHRAERALGGTHMERLRGRIDTNGGGPGGAVGQPGEMPEDVAVLDEYRGMVG